MSTGAVFFAHKTRITERNSHLAGEASGSSISWLPSQDWASQTARRGGDWERGNQATRQCRRIPRNRVPCDCSSLGTLFYGQPSYINNFGGTKLKKKYIWGVGERKRGLNTTGLVYKGTKAHSLLHPSATASPDHRIVMSWNTIL
jgi:hypothetical protein